MSIQKRPFPVLEPVESAYEPSKAIKTARHDQDRRKLNTEEKLALATIMLGELKNDYAYSIVVHEAMNEGIQLAAKQVQERQIELKKKPKEVPIGAAIFDILMIFGLEFKLLGAFVRGIGKGATRPLQRLNQSESLAKITSTSFGTKTKIGRGPKFEALPLPDFNKPINAKIIPLAYETMEPTNAAKAMKYFKDGQAYFDKVFTRDLINSMGKIVKKSTFPKLPQTSHERKGKTISQNISEDLKFKKYGSPSGETAISITLRDQSASHLYNLRYTLEKTISDLQTWLDILKLRSRSSFSVKNFNRHLTQMTIGLPDLEKKKVEVLLNDLLKTLEELLSDSNLPNADINLENSRNKVAIGFGSTYLDLIKNSYFLAYEKALWSIIFGPVMELLNEEKYYSWGGKPEDLNGVVIKNVPIEIVRYWWARFPDPETNERFLNIFQLYLHMKSTYVSLAQLNNTIAKAKT